MRIVLIVLAVLCGAAAIVGADFGNVTTVQILGAGLICAAASQVTP